MKVNWDQVLHPNENIQAVVEHILKEDDSVSKLVSLIQTVARDHYGRGMLHVQQNIISTLDLRILLGL